MKTEFKDRYRQEKNIENEIPLDHEERSLDIFATLCKIHVSLWNFTFLLSKISADFTNFPKKNNKMTKTLRT